MRCRPRPVGSTSPRLTFSEVEEFEVVSSNEPSNVLCILTHASLLEVMALEARKESKGESAYRREMGELDVRAKTSNAPPVFDGVFSVTSDWMRLLVVCMSNSVARVRSFKRETVALILPLEVVSFNEPDAL